MTLNDCEAAAHLHQAVFFRGWGERHFQEFLQDPLIFGLKVEENQDFSGYILWREIKDEAEILTLLVAPSYKRKGKGSLLLAALFEHLIKKNIFKLFLEVAEDNHEAQAFYIKHGFEEIGKRPHYYPRKENRFISALNFLKKLV